MAATTNVYWRSVLNMRQQWMLCLLSWFVQVGTHICFCEQWASDILCLDSSFSAQGISK